MQHALLQPPLTLEHLDTHMIPIEGGTFSLAQDYEVTLSGFVLCRYPVTQRLWREGMGADPSYFRGANRPGGRVPWYDAGDFCNRLSEQQGLSAAYHIDRDQKDPNNRSSFDDLKWTVQRLPGANGYRLPTEAEWEYAARGGRYARGYEYTGSADLDEVGWYEDNSYGETQPVGLLAPNALGLYDMSGNVWEWVWDWYSSYPSGAQDNPTGPVSGERRVNRGGGWLLDAANARVSRRGSWRPDSRFYDLGCRLARPI